MGRSKKEIMEGIEAKQSKIIANNTVEYIALNEDRVIRLHLTDIMRFKPDGSIVLNSGGWKTHITKKRINYHLKDWYIYQEEFVWYLVSNISSDSAIREDYVFKDGIEIKPSGEIIGAGKEKDTKKLRRQINKYVNSYMEALFAGKVSAPGSGDCWYCFFKDKNDRSMGEVMKSSDHIISHMKENYFVPSLLANAIKEIPVSSIASYELYCLWQGEKSTLTHTIKTLAHITKSQLSSSLRRYIRRQIGLAR